MPAVGEAVAEVVAVAEAVAAVPCARDVQAVQIVRVVRISPVSAWVLPKAFGQLPQAAPHPLAFFAAGAGVEASA